MRARIALTCGVVLVLLGVVGGLFALVDLGFPGFFPVHHEAWRNALDLLVAVGVIAFGVGQIKEARS